jgi:hypothetical protein
MDVKITSWSEYCKLVSKKLLSREGSDFASLLCVVNDNYYNQAYAR